MKNTGEQCWLELVDILFGVEIAPPDPVNVLPRDKCEEALRAVRRARWFEVIWDVNVLHLAILISDIRALWRSALSARVPECQKVKCKLDLAVIEHFQMYSFDATVL